MWRAAAALVLGCVAAAVSGQALPSPEAADGAPGCRFTRPTGWQQARALRWSGACREGLADGRGVLLALGGGAERYFYGRMVQGRITFGVVELEGGYLAGHFDGGRLRPSEDRATIVRAFDEASAAARELGGRFRREGNAASARFYFAKAHQLAAQMD